MDNEPTMELTSSDDVPVVDPPAEDSTPSEEVPETTEETPVEPTPETPAEETPAEEMLYETPDGRQINAEQLQTEWKENFLPEFTRKSQALADIEREKELNNTPTDEPAWKKEGYVPQSYAEVIELAKAEAITEMQNTAKAEVDRVASIQDAVETELEGLKKADPKLDANALFVHANKYGFGSLTKAYENMTDMKKSAVDVEQRTVKNLQNRETDPISTGPGGELPDSTGYDPGEMSQYDGAAEYLKHIQKGK